MSQSQSANGGMGTYIEEGVFPMMWQWETGLPAGVCLVYYKFTSIMDGFHNLKHHNFLYNANMKIIFSNI